MFVVRTGLLPCGDILLYHCEQDAQDVCFHQGEQRADSPCAFNMASVNTSVLCAHTHFLCSFGVGGVRGPLCTWHEGAALYGCSCAHAAMHARPREVANARTSFVQVLLVWILGMLVINC